MANNLLLIDLSSIAHAQFHLSGNEPDPNWTATRTVARVHALASGMPSGVAVCIDSPPYFRKDIDPQYKANRTKEHNEVVGHQIRIAIDVLKADGFPVWGVKGYEADDIIATAVNRVNSWLIIEPAHENEEDFGLKVLIASADKDLLQLVSDRVSIKSLKDGSIIGPDETRAKFGVWPHQMVDYLSLVGDTSDNIVGAKGIGAKRAAEILELFGNLNDAINAALSGTEETAITKSLIEFSKRASVVSDLIRLRTDAPIPFEDIFCERAPVAADVDMAFASDHEETMADERRDVSPTEGQAGTVASTDRPGPQPTPAAVVREAGPADIQRDATVGTDYPTGEVRQAVVHRVGDVMTASIPPPPAVPVKQALVVREPDQLAPLPDDWRHQLEPRSPRQLKDMALDLFASKHFSNYGSASGVLATIAAGRELGMHMMASLRAFHIIEGKPAMSADLIRALVLQSPQCEYFRIVERSADKATWVTKRKGDPEVSLTYTIEEGRKAWQKDAKAWDASAWGKRPANMVTKTAAAELARLVYPDVVMNLYSVEEMSGEDL